MPPGFCHCLGAARAKRGLGSHTVVVSGGSVWGNRSMMLLTVGELGDTLSKLPQYQIMTFTFTSVCYYISSSRSREYWVMNLSWNWIVEEKEGNPRMYG